MIVGGRQTSMGPGTTMDKYGIGAEGLRALNPRLIYASSTGYGTSAGPYRDYLGMDITLQAMTLLLSAVENLHRN